MKHNDIKNVKQNYGISLKKSACIMDHGKIVGLGFFNDKITDYSFLASLKHLTHLGFDNKTTDYSFLSSLENLTDLVLRNNNITDCSFLSSLENLINLDLAHNNITDCSFLSSLENLINLNLTNNNIDKIPKEFLNIKSLIWSLDIPFGLVLEGNPISEPPIEVIKSGMDAIKLYYKEIDDKKPLYEAKLIILGEPNAGKTSFVNRLLHDKFNKNSKSTIGTDIHKHSFSKNNKDYNINIWDFGGQEIQQSIHHLFLTSQALYMIVLDARNDENPIKWIETINAFDKKADIIIVINQIDVNAYPSLNHREIRAKSPNIIGIFEVSCLIDNHNGFKELVSFIENKIIKLPSMNEEYPIKWINIKNRLEEEYKQNNMNYMSIDTYHSLIDEYKIDNDASETLLSILDNKGSLRWFKDFEFKNYQIFNPSWLTIGLYSILMDDKVKDNNGIVDTDLIRAILQTLNDDDECEFTYKSEDSLFFIELILHYKFAFKRKVKKYLIPKGFSQREPNNLDLEQYTNSEKYIKYIIKFKDFIPPWIIHRLMVDMFNNIYDEQYWFYGFIYNQNDALIELKEHSKTLNIYIDKNKQDIYSVIKFCLLRVFADSIVLNIDEYVFFGNDNKSRASLSQLENFKNEAISHYRDNETREEREVAELLNFFPNKSINAPRMTALIDGELKNRIDNEQELDELKNRIKELEKSSNDNDKTGISKKIKEIDNNISLAHSIGNKSMKLYELGKGILW